MTKTQDLPVNWSGIALQFGEERANGLFDRFYQNLWSTLVAQDRIFQLGALLSPAPALQLVSQALAGNDTAQHFAFLTQAEHHRREMQRTLNGALRDSKGSTAAFAWEKIPPFVFNPPPLTTALAPLLQASAFSSHGSRSPPSSPSPPCAASAPDRSAPCLPTSMSCLRLPCVSW